MLNITHYSEKRRNLSCPRLRLFISLKPTLLANLLARLPQALNNKALSSKVNVKSSLTELKAVRLLRDVL